MTGPPQHHDFTCKPLPFLRMSFGDLLQHLSTHHLLTSRDILSRTSAQHLGNHVKICLQHPSVGTFPARGRDACSKSNDTQINTEVVISLRPRTWIRIARPIFRLAGRQERSILAPLCQHARFTTRNEIVTKPYPADGLQA